MEVEGFVQDGFDGELVLVADVKLSAALSAADRDIVGGCDTSRKPEVEVSQPCCHCSLVGYRSVRCARHTTR